MAAVADEREEQPIEAEDDDGFDEEHVHALLFSLLLLIFLVWSFQILHSNFQILGVFLALIMASRHFPDYVGLAINDVRFYIAG